MTIQTIALCGLLSPLYANRVTYEVLRWFLTRPRQQGAVSSGFGWAPLSLKTQGGQRHTICLVAWHLTAGCSQFVVPRFCVWVHKPAESSGTASDQGCTCILRCLKRLCPWVLPIRGWATLWLWCRHFPTYVWSSAVLGLFMLPVVPIFTTIKFLQCDVKFKSGFTKWISKEKG